VCEKCYLTTPASVVADRVKAAGRAPAPKAGDAPRRRTHEYKVLTQRDRFFRESFDPEKLEAAIDLYAARGWRVISIATASIPDGFSRGSRDELIVVFERPVAPDA
jgi:hypothetical protein